MKTSLLCLVLALGSLEVGCAAGGDVDDAADILPGEEGDGGEGGISGAGGKEGGGSDPGGKGGSISAGHGGSEQAGSGGDGGSEQGGKGGSEQGGKGGSEQGGKGGVGGAGGATSGCGDGKKGAGEQCDSADLGGQSCATAMGSEYGGKLGCKSNCQFDFNGCAKNPKCGDGAINTASEECDDSDFGGKTCEKVLNKPNATGVLICTKTCKIDSSSCKQGPYCGDGKKGDGEECDGDDLGKDTCATATGKTDMGGILKCNSSCKLDTSGCVMNPKCGDGKVNNVGEECDGSDLVGATCKSVLGNQKAEGTVTCDSSCKYITSGCTIPPYCGDGKKSADEQCDGNDLGSATCESVLGKGHQGQLVCSPDCTISSAKCETVPYCGDGKKNGAEACDGADVSNKTCAEAVGPGSTGVVACKEDCSLDVSGCSVPPNCGNGTLDTNKGEECDGSLLGGKTCATILNDTHAVGSPTCTSACTIDSSGCSVPPYCGDGKLNQPSEECDDGNTKNGDGCNSSCKVVCMGDELKYGKNCYIDSWYFSSGNDYLTWDAAEAYCVAGGGHLASVSSSGENSFLYIDVMPGGLFDPSSPRWIGLNDKKTEGSFVWSSGDPFSYTNWKSGEPNDSGGNEDCVEIRWNDGKWNDNNCTNTRLFICEYPPPVLYP